MAVKNVQTDWISSVLPAGFNFPVVKFLNPSITAVSPAFASAFGGTALTVEILYGGPSTVPLTVTVDGNPCTNVVRTGWTTVQCHAPEYDFAARGSIVGQRRCVRRAQVTGRLAVARACRSAACTSRMRCRVWFAVPFAGGRLACRGLFSFV